jgi:hypothetical protein
MQQQLKKEGYIVLKNFFDKSYIEKIKSKAENIFQIQFNKFGYNGDFKENMIKLLIVVK